MTATALQKGGDPRPERDFHGAAIITADGREIPITEEMVERSLDTLDKAWVNARRPRAVR